MSLINEALKKVQRRQVESQLEALPTSIAGGIPIPKRGKPRSARTVLLLAVAGLVLVVLSVVVTVYLVNRPASPKSPAVVAAASAPKAGGQAAAPAIVVPAIAPPHETATPAVPAEKPAPAAPVAVPPPAVSTAAPAAAAATAPAAPSPGSVADPKANKETTPPPVPVATAPALAPAPAPAAPAAPASATPAAVASAPAPAIPGKADERIMALIEAMRITGVRPAGNDSRVLMNDRVYRLNDIVDRSLSLRLTKVDADHLTFTDANGITYVKYF